ncbi:MAG TPA: hypothetical protein VNU24_00075 [Solirubrobacteraceae bacterium]|jgi:hypothetical protein|nr:hypothetical protein [Solirubrobacteraceae bacterium]
MNNSKAAPLASGLILLALLVCGCGKSSSPTSTSQSATSATATTQAPTTPPSRKSSTPTSTSATSTVVAASSGGVTATLRAGTHHPPVNRAWPLHFTVTHAGGPAKASVSYEYVFGGAVVAHRSHYTFTGHFSDVFHWPATAVGYPLTFRAVIVSEGETIDLDYPVQVTG